MNYFLNILAIFTLLAISIDSYKNPLTFQKFFYVAPSFVLMVFLWINLGLRVVKNIRLPQSFREINLKVVLPLSTFLTVFLTFVDYYTPANFVYNRLLINYSQLGVMAAGSLAVWLINADLEFLKKHRVLLTFISCPVIYFMLLVISVWPFDFFLVLVQEDHPIENYQFVALAISSLISFFVSRKVWKRNKFIAAMYLLAGIGLFLVAGDEISWGQRILHIQTPPELAVDNVQDETNFHNLKFFNDLVGQMYMLVGGYGIIGWLIEKLVNKTTKNKFKEILEWFITPWYLTPYFLFGFTYNFMVVFLAIYNKGEWSEPAELMLDLGVLLFLLERFYIARKFNPQT